MSSLKIKKNFWMQLFKVEAEVNKTGIKVHKTGK